MSAKYPITVSSWTLGDKCTFEERVSAAKNARALDCGQKRMWMR